MANYLAIAAVAKSILKLLEDNCPQAEFSGIPSFAIYSGQDFGSTPVTEGFSVLVYRVGSNASMRNQPARRLPDGRKRLPALPVDLSLLVTPWAAEAERQLRLMGWAMRFLEDHPILPAALLNQFLSHRDIPAFSVDETVEIFHETLALPDYLGLWDKFRNRWQTSLTYAVRAVNIESDIGVAEGPVVQRRDISYDQPAEQAP